MITFDAGLIATILGALAIIAGAIVWAVRLMIRFHRLERHDKRDYEVQSILLEGMFAVLDGLHQQGANGPVTEMREKLKEFLTKR